MSTETRPTAGDVITTTGELDGLRMEVDRLANGITPEMQALADGGRWRALWLNLRTDLRAVLTATDAPPAAPTAGVDREGVVAGIVSAADYPGAFVELLGYVSGVIEEGGAIEPRALHEYLRELKRRYVAEPIREALAAARAGEGRHDG